MKYSHQYGHERQKNYHQEQKYEVQSVEKARSNERKSGWKKVELSIMEKSIERYVRMRKLSI